VTRLVLLLSLLYLTDETPPQPEEVLEYGLIVIWEMLENQQSYFEGRESELLSLLFHLRYANKQTVRVILFFQTNLK
jgi:hypothetical protein